MKFVKIGGNLINGIIALPESGGRIIDRFDEVLEVSRLTGKYDSDTLNKIHITNAFLNPSNSATYSYYKERTDYIMKDGSVKGSDYGGRYGTVKKGEITYTHAPNPGGTAGMMLQDFDLELAEPVVENDYKLSQFTTDDVRTDPTVIKTLVLNDFIDIRVERAKAEVIRSQLKALADTVTQSTSLMYALDIKVGTYSTNNILSEQSRFNAYPDIKIPFHPFYQWSNVQMSPDFYMWNIYDDGSARIKKETLDELERQAFVMLNSSYNFQQRLIDGITLDGNLKLADSSNSNIRGVNIYDVETNKLKITPEGSDRVLYPSEISKDDLGFLSIKYTEQGSTSTPFFQSVSESNKSSLDSEDMQKLVKILKESKGKKKFTFNFGSQKKVCKT